MVPTQPTATKKKRARRRAKKVAKSVPQVELDAPPQLERAEVLADAAEHGEPPPQGPAGPALEVGPSAPKGPGVAVAESGAATAAPALKRRRRGHRGGRGRRKRREAVTSGEIEAPLAVEELEASEERTVVPAEERAPPEAPPKAKAEVSPKKPGRRARPSAAATQTAKKPIKRAMLINVAERDECRVAILHDGRLEELFVERSAEQTHVGNIYKGRVTNVEPSIQAAFIDFGLGKNGFLHISDLQPQYFPDHKGEPENVGKKTPRRDRPPIQRCLRRGQEIIVQVIKEGIGTKGPTLTTYISLPGRYLVMMPGMSRLGVSRKIEDDETRRAMRGMLGELDLPKGMGFILRTAGLDRTKRDLQRDLNYLSRLWSAVAQRIKNERAPAVLYQESDLVIRTIRDLYGSDIDCIVVDDEGTAEKAREFIGIANPRAGGAVECYTDALPLFHKYGIEEEIERIHSREVALPSGGSLVIEPTEALVAIDVNSGRYRAHDNAENTALQTDLEAADEIARQLRLRDLGGLIICDFIDLRFERNKRAVERTLRDALKAHKERAKILRMSQFGVIEMTRQRQGPSIKRSVYRDCPSCRGGGSVKTPESVVLDVLRLVRAKAQPSGPMVMEVQVHPDVAHQLQNRNRAALHALEQRAKCRIVVRANPSFGPDQIGWECRDAQGRVIDGDGRGVVL